MPTFVVSSKPNHNGVHVVHSLSARCGIIPPEEEQIEIGYHRTCVGAMLAAKRIFPNSDGCEECCKPCHTNPGSRSR